MKTMSVRDFLRGGYLEVREATVVMKHGHPVFTVIPHAGQTQSTRITSVRDVVRSVGKS